MSPAQIRHDVQGMIIKLRNIVRLSVTIRPIILCVLYIYIIFQTQIYQNYTSAIERKTVAVTTNILPHTGLDLRKSNVKSSSLAYVLAIYKNETAPVSEGGILLCKMPQKKLAQSMIKNTVKSDR